MFRLERMMLSNVRLLKAAILLASALGVMTDAVVTPALPAVKAQFHEMENIDLWVRLFLTVPALFVAIGSPIAGFIVDRFGRKHYLLASALLIGLSGCMGLFVNSFEVLLLSRAAVGFGIAGTATALAALVSDYFEGEERAQLFGLQAASVGVGATAFLTIGGMLADVRWNAPFLLYLYPIMLVPLLFHSIPSSMRPNNSIEIEGEEANVARPVLGFPIRLMMFVYGLCFVGQLMGYNISAQVPFYLDNTLNLSMGQIGFLMSVNAVAFAIGSISASWYYRRFSPLMVIAIAFPILSTGFFTIATASAWYGVAVGLALNGYGFGVWMPNMNAWLANEAAENQRGRVLGGLTTAVLLGQFVAPILSQPIVASVGVSTLFAVGSLLWLVPGVTCFIYRADLMRWMSRRPAFAYA